jgi:uncharacterized membrane protein
MTDQRKEKRDGQISRSRLILLRVLMAAAIAVSSYLAWTSLSGGVAVGCGPESNCDRVLHSRWAYWFGIPVSIPALLLYVTVLILTFRLGPARNPQEQRAVWPWLFAASILMIGAGVWFTLLQFFLIHSVCPYCMTGHVLGFIAAVIILLQAPLVAAPEKRWQLEKQIWLTPQRARQAAFAALLALATLAGGQVLHQRKTFSVQGVGSLGGSNSFVGTSNVSPALAVVRTNAAPVSATQQVAAPQLEAVVSPSTNPSGGNVMDHHLQIYRGLFDFNLSEVPLIGSPEASYGMVSLFDYTCHHCRIMHPILMAGQRAFSNKLAIVSLPMPLDSLCNYAVRRTPPAHTNACRYAKLGLMVWRADRSKHAQFDEFIFTGEQPPSLEAAGAFAKQLVGNEALVKTAADPWVTALLQQSISIYATNYFHIRNGSMPQLMINTNLTAGALGSPKDFFRVLDKQLGLRLTGE